jgi:hypothetical protein
MYIHACIQCTHIHTHIYRYTWIHTYIHTYIHIGNKQTDIIMQEECGHNYCSNNLTGHFDWSFWLVIWAGHWKKMKKKAPSQHALSCPALPCPALLACQLPTWDTWKCGSTECEECSKSFDKETLTLSLTRSLTHSLSLSLARSLTHSRCQ